MTDNHATCPKCSGTMQEGFVPDYSYGAVIPSSWIKGRPQRSLWFGTKTRDRSAFRLTALRCTNCGFVELYARDRPR